MRESERVKKLCGLIHLLGGKIKTRKKVHKLIYLLQTEGEDFGQSFRFHNYGVFSPPLAYDLDLAKSQKRVSEQDGRDGFSIELLSTSKPIGQIADQFSDRIKELAQKMSLKKPQFLEALSTVVYLSRDFYSGDDLREKFLELKPDLEKYYETACRFARKELTPFA